MITNVPEVTEKHRFFERYGYFGDYQKGQKYEGKN